MSITETAVALSIVAITILGSLSLIGHIETLESTTIKSTLRTCLYIMPDSNSTEIEVFGDIWIGRLAVAEEMISLKAEFVTEDTSSEGLQAPVGLQLWRRTASMGDHIEILETLVYLPTSNSSKP